MGIAVRVLNGGKGIEETFMDDERCSLFEFVLAAPDTSVRWGISEYKETLFNGKQAYQLVREMDALPADNLTPVLRKLRESAEWVYKRTGYLHFIGD